MSLPKKRGRPEIPYTRELAEKICFLIAISSKSLAKICRDNPGLPHVDTIHMWRARHADFSDMYFDAKRHQAVILAEEIIDISDDDSKDDLNSVAVNRHKLRCATRQWHVSRLLPKIFGDRVKEEDDKKELKDTVDTLNRQIDLLKLHEKPY